jgi:hypothetical protein
MPRINPSRSPTRGFDKESRFALKRLGSMRAHLTVNAGVHRIMKAHRYLNPTTSSHTRAGTSKLRER